MEPDDPHSEGLGRAIRVIRAGQDLSRKELAERAGLSYSYVAEIEGGTKSPSTRALAQLARALGVAVHELLAAAARWEHAPPPHSFEELRETTRAAPRAGRPRAGEPSGSRSSAASLSQRLRDRLRLAREEEELEGPDFLRPVMAPLRTEPGGQDEDEAELLELLAQLGPEDRERLLDLARRLAAES